MNDRGVVMGVGSGGFLMWLSTFSVAEWSYIIGAFVALASLVYGFYFQYMKNKRDQEEHEARMRMLTGGYKEPTT